MTPTLRRRVVLLLLLAVSLDVAPQAVAADFLGLGGIIRTLEEVTKPITDPLLKPFRRLRRQDPRKIPATPPADPADEFDEYALPTVSDPLEGFNRAVFAFNDRAYNHAVRPVANGYRRVVPKPARASVTHFFENIRYPVRFAGALLQGKPSLALRETERFLVNTTMGVGGLLRPSDRVPALRALPEEDLGQTFATWGLPRGPYLVLPLFGPTTFRDAAGLAGDSFLVPTSWNWLESYSWTVRAGLQVSDAVQLTPDLLERYDGFKSAALDPYLALRDGYLSYRDAASRN